MSNDAWLIVLGAGLAIVTQLASEFFRHRNEDRRMMRAARREAYVSFLSMMLQRQANYDALAAFRLVAPPDTQKAGSKLIDAMEGRHKADQEGTVTANIESDMSRARTKFEALTQRDLGIKTWAAAHDPVSGRLKSEA